MIERIYFISNSNIPKYEVIRYFINVFGDSLILTFSSFLLLLSIIGTVVYIIFMKTNELRCCSLLNVLNGNLSVYFTFTCALFFIAILAEIPEHQEETRLFICSASNWGFLFMGFLFQVLFFQITGATLLNQIRPDLYQEISLKWNNPCSIFISLVLAAINFSSINLENCDHCARDCVRDKNKAKLIIALVLIVTCLLIQFGVWIDSEYGLKNKRFCQPFVFKLGQAKVYPSKNLDMNRNGTQKLHPEYVTVTTGFITFACFLVNSLISLITSLHDGHSIYSSFLNLCCVSFLTTFKIYKNEQMKSFLQLQLRNICSNKVPANTATSTTVA